MCWLISLIVYHSTSCVIDHRVFPSRVESALVLLLGLLTNLEPLMATHIFEMVVRLRDADQIAEMLCSSLRNCAVSVDISHSDQVLNFGDGRVVIKPNVCGINLRVEADDLLTFLGLRSLLQVALSQASTDQSGFLE